MIIIEILLFIFLIVIVFLLIIFFFVRRILLGFNKTFFNIFTKKISKHRRGNSAYYSCYKKRISIRNDEGEYIDYEIVKDNENNS
ncbi:MAG: hypothetical protein N3A01_00245 [Bacteroidales bacterium]|nr:hypothetical protein [Bacteroidales bacterium]